MKNNKKGFSIIEVLVGIFIFSLGITGIYAVISSTLRINDYNEDYIIATNLAREQLELVRNIRDSNYKKFKLYNLKDSNSINYANSDKFEFGKKYKIYNDYSASSSFPIKIDLDDASPDFFKLCIDNKNRYVYCSGNPGEIKIRYEKYIEIEKVKYKDSIDKIIDRAFLVKSIVKWNKRGKHSFEVKTIIADWKRF